MVFSVLKGILRRIIPLPVRIFLRRWVFPLPPASLATDSIILSPFQVLSAWKEQAIYYREMIADTEADGIQTIVELGVHWGFSLFTLARDYPQAQVIGVDSFCYFDSDLAADHLQHHQSNFPNVRVLIADTVTAGHAWSNPLVYQPIDLLHIDANHSYEGVSADFKAWVDHVRPGGAVMFHDIAAFPDTVGRFFNELPGHDKSTRGNLGVWVKGHDADIVQKPKLAAFQVLQVDLTDSKQLDSNSSEDDRWEHFEGRMTWPRRAMTMIGALRMADLQYCVQQVLDDEIPGDLMEAGVWRGGAAILMRTMLMAYQITDRRVWLADSFVGLPPPNPNQYPADRDWDFSKHEELAVSLEQVKNNFVSHGVLDNKVKFLPGWFRDTLPEAPVEELAILRLDGDLYESTMDTLTHLYPKVSPGGYVIVDDYFAIEPCRKAVDDYRRAHGITESLHRIDWTGMRWRRGDDFQAAPLLHKSDLARYR